VRRWLIGLVAVASCGGPAIQVESQAHHSDVATIERLLVSVDENSSIPFADAITEQLQRCNVTSVVVPRDPLELDQGGRARAAIEKLQPTVVLVLTQSGGRTEERAFRDPEAKSYRFELALREVPGDRTVWSGVARIDAPLDDAAFASKIVAGLRTDGLLKACP
jgi:hypothetical protein